MFSYYINLILDLLSKFAFSIFKAQQNNPQPQQEEQAVSNTLLFYAPKIK